MAKATGTPQVAPPFTKQTGAVSVSNPAAKETVTPDVAPPLTKKQPVKVSSQPKKPKMKSIADVKAYAKKEYGI